MATVTASMSGVKSEDGASLHQLGTRFSGTEGQGFATPKSGSESNLGRSTVAGNQISEHDLINLVDIAKRSGGLEDKDLFSITDLTNRLQLIKEKYSRDVSGVGLALGTTTGEAVDTFLSHIGNQRWSDVVEDEPVGHCSEEVTDGSPLLKVGGLSSPSHEGYLPVSEKLQTCLEGMDLSGLAPQTAGSSNPVSFGFQDTQVRMVSGEDRGQPSRDNRGGRGYGAYRGGCGRGGRGYNAPPNQSERRGNPTEAASHRPAKAWAEVATAPSRSPIKLRYIPPPPSDNPNVVDLPSRSEGLEKWESCLVGYFLDKKLPFNYIRNSASNQWNNMGLKEVLANGDGFMFFMFDNVDSCERVLEGGPWYMGNQLLLLKRWKRMMKLTKEYVSQIPVWVKLFNVPMEYWDFEGLSRIASKIGIPLFMDHLTSTGTRVSFARVCVEVNVESALPQNFLVRCDDEVVEIRVEYQGIPAKCEHCKVFGHDTKKCIANQVAHLVQMQQKAENLQEDDWQTVKAKGKKKIGETLVIDPNQQDLRSQREGVRIEVN